MEEARDESNDSRTARGGQHLFDRVIELEMVTRFDVVLHHSYTATITPVIVATRGTTSTRPAELILADTTRHVITSAGLLDSAMTAGTGADAIFVLVDPSLELFAHSVITTDILAVPNLFAVEADLCTTSWAFELFHLVIRCAHVSLAGSFGAPTDKWVRVKLLLSTEAHKLLIKLNVSLTHDALNQIDIDISLTVMIEALYLVKLCILNVLLQRRDGAVLAEPMLASEFNCTLAGWLASLRYCVGVTNLAVFLFNDFLDLIFLDH